MLSKDAKERGRKHEKYMSLPIANRQKVRLLRKLKGLSTSGK